MAPITAKNVRSWDLRYMATFEVHIHPRTYSDCADAWRRYLLIQLPLKFAQELGLHVDCGTMLGKHHNDCNIVICTVPRQLSWFFMASHVRDIVSLLSELHLEAVSLEPRDNWGWYQHVRRLKPKTPQTEPPARYIEPITPILEPISTPSYLLSKRSSCHNPFDDVRSDEGTVGATGALGSVSSSIDNAPDMHFDQSRRGHQDMQKFFESRLRSDE